MDMAPSIVPEPAPPPSTTSKPMNLRNPLPLSSSQESQVRELYYKRVRSKCAAEIKQFADCARGRTFSTSWACRTQHFAMNSCMVLHATPLEEDAAREEWFTSVAERRRKKEEDLAAVEKRRVEVIELTRRQEEKEMKLEAEKKVAATASAAATAERGEKKGWWR